MSIAERVVALRNAKGLSQSDLARLSGVSQQLVSQIERGVNNSTKHLPALARALGCSVSDLDASYTGAILAPLSEQPPDMVDVYNVEASAGHGALVGHEMVVDRMSFPPGYLSRITRSNPKNLAIIGVKGKSMEPTLSDDDIVMVDLSKTDLSYDGLFVVRDGGDSLLVKRISRGSKRGTVLLVSDNPQYPNQERAFEDVEVVGKVIWKGVKE